MDRLSDDDRELIIQSRLIGRSHQELAATLGKSEVAVRKMLSRARRGSACSWTPTQTMTTPDLPPDARSRADETLTLEDLVADCIELSERGQDEAVESRLAAHPDFQEAARRVLSSLRDAGMVGPSAFEDSMPERLGDYRLIRRLGQGGMGVVYLARQESLDRLVAVKVIHPALAVEPRLQARFEREARAIARLDHPNVVRVHGSGTEQGHLFIAMEFIAGEDLAERCRRERPTIPQTLEWIRDVARALQCAHEADLVHRDVKPANILLHPQRGAVLLDFGLARDLGGESLTISHSFQGSPHYASPEQIRGQKVGPASDVYSLGVTLYECVIGVPPFKGDTTEQVFSPDPVGGCSARVRRADASIPRDLETVIHAALERDPARRLPSAKALADDLEALLTVRPIRTRPPGLLRRLALWSRRHRLAASMILLALLVSVTAITGAVLRDRVAEAERRETARQALDRARTQLDAYVRSSEEAVAFEQDVVRRSQQMSFEFHEDEEWRALGRDRERQRQERSRREDVFAQVFADLDRAGSFAAFEAEVRMVRAEAFLERWKLSRAQGDIAGAEYYRRKVEELDRHGEFAAQLAGVAAVQFRSEPEGADVFVLRYEEHGALYDSGEPRLVPVPIAGEPPIAPGTWCLRVVEAVEPLQVGDLIAEVAGHPVEGSVLVGLGDGEVQRLDRLTQLDGEPIASIPDYRFRLGWERGDLSPHTMTFLREGEEFTVDVNDPAAFRVAMGTPAEIAMQGGCEAQVVRDGEVLSLDLPTGFRVVTTAAPILTTPRRASGRRRSPSIWSRGRTWPSIAGGTVRCGCPLTCPGNGTSAPGVRRSSSDRPASSRSRTRSRASRPRSGSRSGR